MEGKEETPDGCARRRSGLVIAPMLTTWSDITFALRLDERSRKHTDPYQELLVDHDEPQDDRARLITKQVHIHIQCLLQCVEQVLQKPAVATRHNAQ